MDGQEKYVAYVGTYTHGSSIGTVSYTHLCRVILAGLSGL